VSLPCTSKKNTAKAGYIGALKKKSGKFWRQIKSGKFWRVSLPCVSEKNTAKAFAVLIF
jgi:hypothetical protein